MSCFGGGKTKRTASGEFGSQSSSPTAEPNEKDEKKREVIAAGVTDFVPDQITLQTTAREFAAIVEQTIARAKEMNAPRPAPPPKPPQKPKYAREEPLPPGVRRAHVPPTAAPSDVTSPANIATPDGRPKHFSELRQAQHAQPRTTPLASRDYARYAPGTGPLYGGPSFPAPKGGGGGGGGGGGDLTRTPSKQQKAAAAAKVATNASLATTQTLVFSAIVASLSLAPIAYKLFAALGLGDGFRPGHGLTAREAASAAAAAIRRWKDDGEDFTTLLTMYLSVIFVLMGLLACVRQSRGPMARWLIRVRLAVGVTKTQAHVAVVVVAVVAGVFGGVVSIAAGNAITQMLTGNHVKTFALSATAAAVSCWYHERRKRGREIVKRGVCALYDAEKDKKALERIMGKFNRARDKNAFAMGNACAPTWARFAYDEKVKFLNDFLGRMWPHVNRAVSDMLTKMLDPLLETYRPSILSKVFLDQFDLGDESIQISRVSFVGLRSDDMGLSLDFNVQWNGNSKIMIAATTHIGTAIKIGVKDLEMYASVRVTLQPFVPTFTPFAGMTISLTEKPKFDFDLELPLGLEGRMSTKIQNWLEGFLSDVLGNSMVWPERINVPLAFDNQEITLKNGETMPYKKYYENVMVNKITGIVVVAARHATDVPSVDMFSPSDPYLSFQLRGKNKIFTKVVDNDANPVWNEQHFMLVDDVNARKLKVDVMDDDANGLGNDDDCIGSTTVVLDALEPQVTKSFTVAFPETAKINAKKGLKPMTVTLDLTYVPFDIAGGEGSAAEEWFRGWGMLTVKLISGKDLKVGDYNGFSDPYCKLAMEKAELNVEDPQRSSADAPGEGGKASTKRKKGSSKRPEFIRHKSKVIQKTLDPEWGEEFEFVGVLERTPLIVECFDRDVMLLKKARSIHWSPYDPVGVVNADP